MKPIAKAHILDNACPICGVIFRQGGGVVFYCKEQTSGDYEELCTQEDWSVCPLKDKPGRAKLENKTIKGGDVNAP